MNCTQCNDSMEQGKRWWVDNGTVIKDLNDNIVLDNSNEFPGHEIDSNEAQDFQDVVYCSTCSRYVEVDNA